MKYISVWLLAGFICFAFAGQRIEKIVRPDTILTVKPDTIKTFKVDTVKTIRMDSTYSLRLDTIIITTSYRDSLLVVKQDTTRKYSKPIKLRKK